MKKRSQKSDWKFIKRVKIWFEDVREETVIQEIFEGNELENETKSWKVEI